MNLNLITCIALGGAALLFAAEAPRKEPSELDKLKAKVELLEGRVNQLEVQVRSLNEHRRTTFEIPKLDLRKETEVPPNIGEINVNGLKVYKVPLTESNR